LKPFLADDPMVKAYFVYGGTRRMYEGKIKIVPVAEMLRDLKNSL
jgi:hypothetical protein